jgi:hypothetical protein
VAIGTAVVKGAKVAAAELDMPRRTLSKWVAGPESNVLKQEHRDELDDLLMGTIRVATQELIGQLQDPKVSIITKAKTLRYIGWARLILAKGQAFDEIGDWLTQEPD